jgi:hypothetical protein
MEQSGELSNKSCGDWLRAIWEHHDRKASFELNVPDWVQDYPNLMQLIQDDKRKHRIRAWPCKDYGDMDNVGTPNVIKVEITPSTLRELEPPETVHRQTTVSGRPFDLRNRVNQEIWMARAQDLAINCECWLRNLSDPFSKKRNASERCLQTALSLRGKDLEDTFPELYATMRDALRKPLPDPSSGSG